MAEMIAVVTAKSAWQVIKVVKSIRTAVATDRRNHKEYQDISRCMNRVESVVKSLHGPRELAVRPVLGDLAGSLNAALKLIQRCQGRNTIHRLYKAEDTAKALSRVKDDIDHHLLMVVFAGMMQIFTLPNTIQPHQIAMISIMVDLECCLCKKKMEKILFTIREEKETVMIQAKISFDTANNMVIIAGWFDVQLLTKKIVCKAGKVVKNIKIMEDEEEAQENDTIDETRELAKASEWPGELGRRIPGHGKSPATTMIQGTPKATKYPSPSSKRVAQKHPPWR